MGWTALPSSMGVGSDRGPPSPLLFFIAIDPLQQIFDVATRKGLLQKIWGRGVMMWTSLYADNTTVFMAPIKRDIDNLAAILRGFEKVTSLYTNFNKSAMVPIRYSHLDLEHITHILSANRASFQL